MSKLQSFIEFEKTVIPPNRKFEVQAFSVYRSFQDFVHGKPYEDAPSDEYYYRRWLIIQDNAKKKKSYNWVIGQIKRIGSEMHQGLYSKKDLTIAILFIYLYCKRVNLKDINYKSVSHAVRMLSKEEYEKSKQFVLSVGEQSEINSIEDMFKITADGTSLLYKYIVERQFISPVLFINLVGKIPTENIRNANDNYKKFQRITLAIGAQLQ